MSARVRSSAVAVRPCGAHTGRRSCSTLRARYSGAEVAPLAHAVGPVNGKQAQQAAFRAASRARPESAVGGQPLGRGVQQHQLAARSSCFSTRAASSVLRLLLRNGRPPRFRAVPTGRASAQSRRHYHRHAQPWRWRTMAAPGSTGLCRRRWASAPAHRPAQHMGHDTGLAARKPL